MLQHCTAAIVTLSLAFASATPTFAHGRFGGGLYTGRPNLSNTLALVVAGGGPDHFKTTTLVGVLAGSNANAFVAKLTKRYGASTVKQFISTFDFVVADALRLVKQEGITLPLTPLPDPDDGKALASALYTAGVDSSNRTFSVEYMLDHLVSHSLHVQIMKDIDAKYGVEADSTYHAVLLEVMEYLKAA